MRMLPRIRFEMRCVWPTIIASTVGSCSASAIPRIGPSHERPRRCRSGSGRVRALVDHDDSAPARPPRCADAPDSALIRGASSRNVRPGRARRDELGRVLQLGADHADLDPVHGEDDGRRHPRRPHSGRRLDDVRRQEREVRPRLVLEQAGDAVVELVVPVRRCVQAPRVLDVDRRLVLQQAGVRRRRADVVTAARIRPPPSEASSSSNIVARNEAPPTGVLIPSNASVVGSS